MAVLDTIRNALKPDDTKAREQLEILKKAAMGELDKYRSELIQKMRNPDAFREEIVPYKMFEHIEQYRVSVTDKAADEISSVVDSFFSGGEKNVKDGFSTLIKFAFNAILGSTSIGESSTKNWYIALERGALIRVDVMAWRYNFSGDGLIAEVKNAFCFTATKSFVDAEELKAQELIYFVAKSLKLESVEEIVKNPTLEQYVRLLKDGYKRAPVHDAIDNYARLAGRPVMLR
ncbi:hypothetical protein AB4Z48_03370 [Cupriavidus sp. 2TAF22]|uniref:hypothetical protein n=1 Tax=unclassified Cupriavidus TaxID=2640874 RepID=UPI003F91EAF7